MNPVGPYPIIVPGEAPHGGGCWFIHEDFTQGPAASSTDDAATFDLVGTSAAAALSDTDDCGVVTVTSNTTNVGALVQNGEPVSLKAGRDIWFWTRVNLVDADGMSFFAGLAITDSDQWDTSLTDYIGFFTTDGSINYGCGKDNNNVPGSGTSGETDADSGVDFADNEFVELAFHVSGLDRVDFYVNKQHVGTIRTNLPDNERLTTTFSAKGSGEVFDVDYAFGWQSR